MNINTRQLHAFVLVSQHGSFTKAAERMHITQAGLSALVRELESQLGVRLFERTTRRVTLTAEGRRFLPQARQVDQGLEAARREFESERAGQRRLLRVAASPSVATGMLPLVLKRHLAHYPEDCIELLDVSRSEVLPEVESGNADIGLGIFFRPVSGIRQYRLFSSSLMLISPAGWKPSSPFAGGPRAAMDLRAVPADRLIRLPQDNPFQQWIDARLLAAHNLAADMDSCIRLRNIESCIAMVEIGRGHFIAPDFVRPVCRRYAVRANPIQSERDGVDFYAIGRAGAELGRVARDFAGSLVKTVTARRIGRDHAASASL